MRCYNSEIVLLLYFSSQATIDLPANIDGPSYFIILFLPKVFYI